MTATTTAIYRKRWEEDVKYCDNVYRTVRAPETADYGTRTTLMMMINSTDRFTKAADAETAAAVTVADIFAITITLKSNVI
uniref:FAS1 domain-containing protein n=1 Tax=Syphacia muris TaxID=451379 RepID=A0A0N5AH81_9BILA